MKETINDLKSLNLPENPMVVLAISDWMWREDFTNSLNEKLGQLQIEQVSTEHKFVQRIPVWVKAVPDMFVIGCQMRWTDPSPRMPLAPKEVRDGGFESAGVRCIKRLSQNKVLGEVPIVYFCDALMASEHSGVATLSPTVYIGEFLDIENYSFDPEVSSRRKIFF